ncbi:MAG: ASKHA domain-containing protein, partial [Candidatus Rokuibacteriota bacterium]
MTVSLTFLPDPADPSVRREVPVSPGTTILQAAHGAGIEIEAVCGGRGRCTSCRVKFVTGAPPPPTIMDEVQLGDALVRDGYRLSCQCHVTDAVTVQPAPPLEERSFQILGAGPGAAQLGIAIDSGIEKQVVKVGLPRDEHHQTSDLEQVLAAVGLVPDQVGASVLASLPAALRDDPDGVTVTTFTPGGGGHLARRLLAVERGDTSGMRFGLAIDVGTTTVVTTLIELESGEQLASVASLNPQSVFGGDLMSRIAFAQFNPGNLRKLHTRIVALLNQHVAQVCRESGVLARWIYKAVVVGNTCMHHLLLGIDPSYVGLAPYAPVMRHALTLPARDLFLKIAPEARVCLLPLVAGFVGADAVAVALATRIGQAPEVRIAVDIGTNGEVLLGSAERLWACSAPAGPALEGAQIRCGMRGAVGAIDRVAVEGDVRVHTIGEVDARGICGSGLIDLLAGLLDAGVIDRTGLIQVEGRDAL